MRIVKSTKSLQELTSKKVTNINVFYKGNYKYTIGIVENENLIAVTKEDTKSEYFETEYFEII